MAGLMEIGSVALRTVYVSNTIMAMRKAQRSRMDTHIIDQWIVYEIGLNRPCSTSCLEPYPISKRSAYLCYLISSLVSALARHETSQKVDF